MERGTSRPGYGCSAEDAAASDDPTRFCESKSVQRSCEKQSKSHDRWPELRSFLLASLCLLLSLHDNDSHETEISRPQSPTISERSPCSDSRDVYQAGVVPAKSQRKKNRNRSKSTKSSKPPTVSEFEGIRERISFMTQLIGSYREIRWWSSSLSEHRERTVIANKSDNLSLGVVNRETPIGRVGSGLAPAPQRHHLINQDNLTDERSNNKPLSNSAPAPNSSDEIARARMQHKPTDNNEAKKQRAPKSRVTERDTSDKANRPTVEWFLASGAVCHATGDMGLIRNLRVLQDGGGGLSVRLADGTQVHVNVCGDVVTDNLVLPNVYFVAGLRTNLVSVAQLVALGHSVAFGRGACVVNSAAGGVVGRAHARDDGLYQVDFLRVPLGMP